MIALADAKPGLVVWYGQIEYGMITSVNDTYVFVRFGVELHSKACRPEDLHWPPSYCAQDGGVEGQIYGP